MLMRAQQRQQQPVVCLAGAVPVAPAAVNRGRVYCARESLWGEGGYRIPGIYRQRFSTFHEVGEGRR